MRMESRRARSIDRAMIAILLLLASAAGIAAEDGDGSIALPAIASALPQEAPESLFNAKIGKGPDDDAELFVSGSWSASLIADLGLRSESGSSLALSSAQPLLFTQSPDLSLSFLLYKKVFVEARVAEDLTQAMYAAGYRGGKGELLEEARIGNAGISFPTLPFLSFGDGSYRSFGAAAKIGSEGFTGRALVRYDQADRVVRRFVGESEISETDIGPSSYISGKYFLTRTAPASGPVLYVQSASGTLTGGDAKLYRKMSASEYSFSAASGLVSLASAVSTRLLAYYAGSGSSDSVSVDGRTCELLCDPPDSDHASATLDPKLQALNRYATTASSATAEAFVRSTASGLRDEDFQARIDDAGFIEVTRADADDPSALSTEAERAVFRQPFASAAYADMDWLYTTDFDSSTKADAAPVYTREIVLRSFSSSQGISIGKDIVSGSIEVTRDGVPDYGFTVDADTGMLKLGKPASASEEIVVSYMKESAERKSGNLAAALGGFWDLGESRSAWAALGASWALPGSSYASDSRTNPGSVALTLGEKDDEGSFRHEVALAARYSRDDSTGRYRIEGMESSSDYSTTFRDGSPASGYSSVEHVESGLAAAFPSLASDLHSDGSSQKALEISSSSATAGEARFYKVESTPPYSSFTSFSFFAKIPAGVSLTLCLDDGSAASPEASVSVSIPDPGASAGEGSWKRYSVRYGDGDAAVYAQGAESADETILAGAAATLPGLLSSGSRLVAVASGISSAASLWIDEVLLEGSVGRAAGLFQGSVSYANPKLSLGSGKLPIVSGLAASSDVQASLADSSYASFGVQAASRLLFADIALKGRMLVQDGSTPSFRGGHSIGLPSFDFPAHALDAFEYDPATGAFDRSDSLSLAAGGVAALSLAQESAWTPASTELTDSLLVQSWDGKLVLGPGIATLGLTARNRASSVEYLALPGEGYGPAWIGAFEYVLPALESSADLREAKATLSLKGEKAKEYLSGSLGESAEPSAAGGALHRDSAYVRLSLPLELGGLSLEPYYSRSWKDKRSDAADGIVGDAKAALGDFSDLSLLYLGIPFSELASDRTKSAFSSQTEIDGAALPAARFEPESGLSLSREYGSKWYDLALPSTLGFSFKRSLVRADDTVSDTGLWTAQAKFAAINLFGSMGAYPLAKAFDSDEYLSSLQATLAEPSGGGASSLDLQLRSLATFYGGETDKLDADGKLSVVTAPSSLSWTSALSLSLSRRIARHWLLSLYSLAVKPAPDEAAVPDPPSVAKASIASMYIEGLAKREPNLRSTIGLKGSLSGLSSDAAAYAGGWSLGETYEAKLTVPERLTLKVDAELSQGKDASTQVFSLGFLLSLNAVISF